MTRRTDDRTPNARRARGTAGGASSVSVALLTPVFVVLALAAVQAALWSHARTEARVVARDTATLVARGGADPAAARASAREILTADTDLGGVGVRIDVSNGLVTVVVSGRAPGIIVGTAVDVDVTEVVPREELVAR